MASSMVAAAATATQAAKISPAAAEESLSVDKCKDGGGCSGEDALSSSLRSCANDPDFAVICAFLQKFAKDLDLDLPNFKLLQEGLTNTDEVSPQLRDLHIKLLRKTRKTVHEKSWESALSKFCWFYSAQDAWEVERFGYKKSSLKVKLRILRELLESQFERNGKFRAKLLTYSADSLRAEPIGRDRLGHSYWLTQDNDCNLRIYQEHLDEDIWQVVATNRDEFVNLISRLRGNEVVLPSSDIGIIDEDTSSSGNSGAAVLEKPPPPEEQDDSQEDEVARVPNLRIKLNSAGGGDVGKGEEELAAEEDAKLEKQREMGGATEEELDEESDLDEFEEEEDESEAESEDEAPKKVKPLLITQAKLASNSPTQNSVNSTKKRTVESVDKSSPTREEPNAPKKARPTLLDSKREKKPSRYEKSPHDDEESDVDEEEEEEEEEEEDEEDDDIDSESIESEVDSAAADEDENETKDQLDTEDDDVLGEAIEDPPVLVSGEGTGQDCDCENAIASFGNCFDVEDREVEFGSVIEEPVFYIVGEGEGATCLVGNTKTEVDASSASATATPKASTEPQATFFFGVPGCLKLSPMKKTTQEESKCVSERAQEKQTSETSTEKNSNLIENSDTKELLAKEQNENPNYEKLNKDLNEDIESKEEENGTIRSQEQIEEKKEETIENTNGKDTILEEKSQEECKTSIEKDNDNGKKEVNEFAIVNKINSPKDATNEFGNIKPQAVKQIEVNVLIETFNKEKNINFNPEKDENLPSTVTPRNLTTEADDKPEAVPNCTLPIIGTISDVEHQVETSLKISPPPAVSSLCDEKNKCENLKEINMAANKNLHAKDSASPSKASEEAETVVDKSEKIFVIVQPECKKGTDSDEVENKNKTSEKETSKQIYASTETTTESQLKIMSPKVPIIYETANKIETFPKIKSPELSAMVEIVEEIPPTQSAKIFSEQIQSKKNETESTNNPIMSESAKQNLETETMEKTQKPSPVVTIQQIEVRNEAETSLKILKKESPDVTSADMRGVDSLELKDEKESQCTTATKESASKSKEEIEKTKTQTQTQTSSCVKEVEKILPSRTINTDTDATVNILAASTSSLHNRKRRLAEFALDESSPSSRCHRRHSTSESEPELHIESEKKLTEENDDLVGGKRPKMRPKLTNIEVRKKVEALKVAIEETTSSSGEEDAHRRRKLITPSKRQIEELDTKSPTKQVVNAEKNDMNEKELQTKDLAATSEDVITKPIQKDLNLLTNPKATNIAVGNTIMSTAVVHSVVRQKPTLAEIIEKKLKKTSLSPATEVPPTSNSTPTFSPPKKTPIMKPLKKNLLTQIRQVESDEEAIPRKRTISVTTPTLLATVEKPATPKIESKILVENTDVRNVEILSPKFLENEEMFEEKKNDHSKVTVSLRKTSDRKTPERQRKRRSSEELQQPTPDQKDSTDGVCEKVKKNNERDKKEDVLPAKVEGIKEISDTIEEQHELPRTATSSPVVISKKSSIPTTPPASLTANLISSTTETTGKTNSLSSIPASESTKILSHSDTRSGAIPIQKISLSPPTTVVKTTKIFSDPVKSTTVVEDISAPHDLPASAETVKIVSPPGIQVSTTVSPKQQTPAIGRRSGRRGGAAVIYAELPQPKRTRAGVVASLKTNAKKDEDKIEKAPDVPKAHNEVTKDLKDAVKLENEKSKVDIEPAKPIKETAKPVKKSAKLVKETTKPMKEIAKFEKELEIKNVEIKNEIVNQKEPEHVKPPPPPIEKIKTENKMKSLEINLIDDSDLPSSQVQSFKSAVQSPTAPITPGRGRGGRKKREVDTTNIIDTADAETPVRQSRRIAQQKIREEAERRKLEEIALRTMKQELKKKKKAEKQADPTVIEPSEHSSSASSEESEVETKKKAKKKCPGKDGWSSGSEEQEEPEEEDEEPPHYDTDPGSPLFKSDHEFSPESDLEDSSQVVPMKRARTVRKEDAEEGDSGGDEEACQKCGKSDHPEWILLCDKCDRGYHCSCLSPVLFYIPEGQWFCPPCQQEQLITALERQLKEFDDLVDRKRLEEVEEQRLNAEAKRVEEERLEEEKLRKERKKEKKEKQRDGKDMDEISTSSSNTDTTDEHDDAEKKKKKKNKSKRHSAESGEDAEKLSKKLASSKRVKKDDHDGEDDDDNEDEDNKSKRRRGNGRRRRRAATRGARHRRQHESNGSYSDSDSDSRTDSDDSSSATATDSDDEPIYKLRKRRQINVSYRLNEYDDLINSALKKEMDEAAGAGNLGRGKDISTIIEADKEEQARKRQQEDGEVEEDIPNALDSAVENEVENVENKEYAKTESTIADMMEKKVRDSEDEDKDETLKRKAKPKPTLKKKPRKLTTLDVSSEEDHGSDEDFKTSSFEDEEDEDTSNSVSSNSSDSSLEVYRRRNKGGKKKKQRKAARKAARERRKDRKFVVDESDEDDAPQRPKTKKKRKEDSDYTESETGDDDQSEQSENMDSADLCDDTTSDDSDGAWHPSKRKKQRKSNAVIARKSPKLKKTQVKKVKRVEYSDDDISESEEEEEDEEDDGIGGSGKGSGKQPRSQPLKVSSNTGKGKGKGGSGSGNSKSSGKGKGKGKTSATKKKKKRPSDDEDSFSDTDDSTRRTRGRRYAYLDDYEDESSDGGIKPGVKRPDTPPEEREKFIQKQEEIKRMLAAKNAEGAKLAATPRLTPIKGAIAGDKRTPTKTGSDSLSTVPLSVIRQAKVLDIDYLQRKGESIAGDDNVDDVDSEFDDADLPDDFPEDMDEDAIARMVEEEEEFGASAAARELPAPDEVLRSSSTLITAPNKIKTKDSDKVLLSTNPSLAALSQMPGASPSGLQEPLRKRLPMPTMHPPLLRHQFQPHLHHGGGMPPAHMLQRQHHAGPPTHLLQNALCAPLGQSLNRNFPHHQRMPGIPTQNAMHLMPARQSLPASQPLGSHLVTDAGGGDTEAKPRGRRKKITPLRDPLQKQQAAAAATAAAVHAATSSDKSENAVPTSAAVASVIKTAKSGSVAAATPSTTTLSIAQPPQLYKPVVGSGTETQPSVITRMPHLPPGRPGCGPPAGMYNEVARFYGPISQGSPSTRQPLTAQQRHRGSLQMPCMPPHPGMRPTYGPPPPLRGAGTPPNHGNQQTAPTSSPSAAARGAPPYVSSTQSEQQQPHHHGGYGPPPPARHAASHLNPYRPPIYGNPNFAPRAPPPGSNLRPPPGAMPGAEYAGGTRGYPPPFGYYPPPLPPPLSAAHQPPLTHAAATATAAASSSVIVAAPLVQQSSPVNHNTPTVAQRSAKTSPPPGMPVSNKGSTVPRKKLITLEAYSAHNAAAKSPLAIGGESSGSRSSPSADDSSSAPAAATAVITTTGVGGGAQVEDEEEGQASEFSGLVSYFSSQHDDYNS